jgi:hypothetical protein
MTAVLEVTAIAVLGLECGLTDNLEGGPAGPTAIAVSGLKYIADITLLLFL